MTEYRLEREQWIAAPLSRVFAFFSDIANLEVITPRWVGFRIRTPLPVEMKQDTVLEYQLLLAGVPVSWRTRIVRWEPPSCFVDVQERGPYALWEHAHRFEPFGDGGMMRDTVRYRLPFGILGRGVHAVAVRPALAAIFDHRFRAIRELFSEGGSARSAPSNGGG